MDGHHHQTGPVGRVRAIFRSVRGGKPGPVKWPAIAPLASQLECDANTNSAAPANAALLSDVAIKKFETIRQRHHWIQLNTCAASGIINYFTVNGSRFGPRDNLGLAGHQAGWSHSFV